MVMLKKILLMVALFSFTLFIVSCAKKSNNTVASEIIETTNVETSITPETTEAVVYEEGTLNYELQEVEKKADIFNEVISDAHVTQGELNERAHDLYVLWDVEINSLWKRIKEKDNKTSFNKLKKEEEAWVAKKEKRRKETRTIYEGGSMEPMIEDMEAAEMTRVRCYELAVYLGKLIGEDVEPLKISLDGRYVDTQGTGQEAYSDIKLKSIGGDTYDTVIDIYRLCQLTGTSKGKDGNLKFEGLDPNGNVIKGDIIVKDNSATFTVTDSIWGYLPNGEKFTFPDKWELGVE